MTSFDFDVIGESPRKALPNVQKPPAPNPAGEKQPEKAEQKPREKAA